MSIDLDRFRTLLIEERRRVEGAIDNVHHTGTIDDEVEEMSGTADNHMGETATATLDREIDYTLAEHEGRILLQIDAALQRVAAGTYGTCGRCSEEIPAERLEATPWTALCVGCQREAERR
jgi:DnaK suppressor protein